MPSKPARSAGLSAPEVHAISRVLSDLRRFEILKRIAATDCAACSELREAFPITAATLSHHLKELESAGLIETARRGKFVDITFRRNIWKAYLASLRAL